MSEEWRKKYLPRRQRYKPDRPTLVIVAESPPDSGRYFYDLTGVPTEHLFAALMKQLGVSPITKNDGLVEFQRRGWTVIDATYEPVNKYKGSRRDAVIARDYPLLRRDLQSLNVQASVPLILIKANVCRILEPKLTEDGFNVLNRGRPIYFPSHGQQKKFHEQFGAVLNGAGTN